MTDDDFRKYLCTYLQISCSMLADPGDTIVVDYVVGNRTTVYRIHSSRLGRILGIKGSLITAIRTLAMAAGLKRGIRLVIDLIENYETQMGRQIARPKILSLKKEVMTNGEFRKHICAYLQMSCELLADSQDKLIIDCVAGKKATLYRIQTTGVGRILGRQGRLITAIRDVANACGRYNGMPIEIEVIKNDEGGLKVA